MIVTSSTYTNHANNRTADIIEFNEHTNTVTYVDNLGVKCACSWSEFLAEFNGILKTKSNSYTASTTNDSMVAIAYKVLKLAIRTRLNVGSYDT